MAKLVLFDINGTLITRDSRTDIPYANALDEVLAVTGAMTGVNTAARSDQDVFLEVLERLGRTFSRELWIDFMTVYEKHLDRHRESDIWRSNLDSADYVRYLAGKNIPLALVSGELRIGARYKLEKIGLWRYFPVGGFGEDGLVRRAIAEKALAKAQDHFKEVFQDIWVVGDTVLDIETARHLGGRVISLAGGADSRSALEAAGPDFLVDRFSGLLGGNPL